MPQSVVVFPCQILQVLSALTKTIYSAFSCAAGCEGTNLQDPPEWVGLTVPVI